ncbi:hypothetical protein AVEN_95173-1, partial [Araneus ventricosus]
IREIFDLTSLSGDSVGICNQPYIADLEDSVGLTIAVWRLLVSVIGLTSMVSETAGLCTLNIAGLRFCWSSCNRVLPRLEISAGLCNGLTSLVWRFYCSAMALHRWSEIHWFPVIGLTRWLETVLDVFLPPCICSGDSAALASLVWSIPNLLATESSPVGLHRWSGIHACMVLAGRIGSIVYIAGPRDSAVPVNVLHRCLRSCGLCTSPYIVLLRSAGLAIASGLEILLSLHQLYSSELLFRDLCPS